eukprot:m.152950 g.152950  ORF g.152950 m.152950 type:complete len:429 (+) comp17451_c0_seq3:655-1941(+)
MATGRLKYNGFVWIETSNGLRPANKAVKAATKLFQPKNVDKARAKNPMWCQGMQDTVEYRLSSSLKLQRARNHDVLIDRAVADIVEVVRANSDVFVLWPGGPFGKFDMHCVTFANGKEARAFVLAVNSERATGPKSSSLKERRMSKSLSDLLQAPVSRRESLGDDDGSLDDINTSDFSPAVKKRSPKKSKQANQIFGRAKSASDILEEPEQEESFGFGGEWSDAEDATGEEVYDNLGSAGQMLYDEEDDERDFGFMGDQGDQDDSQQQSAPLPPKRPSLEAPPVPVRASLQGGAPALPERENLVVPPYKMATKKTTPTGEPSYAKVDKLRKWFRGKIGRDDSMVLLHGCSEGTFIVRESATTAGFSLDLVSKSGKLRHFKILNKLDKFSISGHQSAFDTLNLLVDHYHRHDITLEGDKLRYPCENQSY